MRQTLTRLQPRGYTSLMLNFQVSLKIQLRKWLGQRYRNLGPFPSLVIFVVSVQASQDQQNSSVKYFGCMESSHFERGCARKQSLYCHLSQSLHVCIYVRKLLMVTIFERRKKPRTPQTLQLRLFLLIIKAWISTKNCKIQNDVHVKESIKTHCIKLHCYDLLQPLLKYATNYQ